MLERGLGLGNGAGKLLRLGTGVGKLRLHASLALSPLGQRLLGCGEGLCYLLEAALVHAVLDLGVRDLVLELGKGEGLPICLGARLALVCLALVEGVLQLAPMRHGVPRRLRERLHALLELALAHAGIREVPGHALVLLGHIRALLAHGRELHAHLGEARDHVLALLLQKAHVRVHAAEDVLHAATLLAEVAHKEALLLEERLVLLELCGLLVQAVLGKLDGGIGLAAAGRERAVGGLQAAQVVNRELRAQLGQALGDVVGALCLVDLPLEGLELAVNLTLDHLSARKVIVHRRELAKAALLAPAVLGDVCRLLDELAALLRAALEDGVKLALADDRVGVLAQAGVVEDVLHVHKARGRAVDEVLGLARAIHPARDAHLGEVDGQRVI